MRSTLSLIVAIACIGNLLLPHLYAQETSINSKSNTLDILVEAYEGKNRVKDVTYDLELNGNQIASVESKKGSFNFVMKSNDGVYTLRMSKSGYLSKEIIFDSFKYPFDNEYELQEIILECVPISTDMDEVVYAGTMQYDPVARAFRVNKSDTINAKLSSEVKKNAKQLDDIYQKAIYNGDGLQKIEEYEYAKGYYEIALLANPADDYATEQLHKADSLAKIEAAKPAPVFVAQSATQPTRVSTTANEPEKEAKAPVENKKPTAPTPAPTGQYFSVQLGAFVDWYNENVFTDVPDLLVVRGTDYKRILSGKFTTREEADQRKTYMRNNGFKDAFVVTMKGNERIGF